MMSDSSNVVSKIIVSDRVTVYHRGPPLTKKPLPSVFYFAHSGLITLTVEPFKQFADFLADSPIHVFSLSLPGHLDEAADIHTHNSVNQLSYWVDRFLERDHVIDRFIEECKFALNFLIDHEYVDPRYIAAAGVSRGAFIASHLAASEARIQTVLGFAPLTDLGLLKDFRERIPESELARFSVESLAPLLAKKKLRFYIGNHDTRVGTGSCFNVIEKVTKEACSQGIRGLPIECTIYPSIGHKGHGTPTYIFEEGALWIKRVFESFESKTFPGADFTRFNDLT